MTPLRYTLALVLAVGLCAGGIAVSQAAEAPTRQSVSLAETTTPEGEARRLALVFERSRAADRYVFDLVLWSNHHEQGRWYAEATRQIATRAAAAARATATARASSRSSYSGGGGAGGTLASIRACESQGNYGAISSTGRYRGAYQFSYETWASVGGSGDPAAATPAEQDHRAAILLARSGRAPWPICGYSG